MLSVTFDLLVKWVRCFFCHMRGHPIESFWFLIFLSLNSMNSMRTDSEKFNCITISFIDDLFRGREDGNKWCLIRMELRLQIINTRVKIDCFMLTYIPKSHWSVISPEWICAQMTPVSLNGPTDEMLGHPSISYLCM